MLSMLECIRRFMWVEINCRGYCAARGSFGSPRSRCTWVWVEAAGCSYPPGAGSKSQSFRKVWEKDALVGLLSPALKAMAGSREIDFVHAFLFQGVIVNQRFCMGDGLRPPSRTPSATHLRSCRNTLRCRAASPVPCRSQDLTWIRRVSQSPC